MASIGMKTAYFVKCNTFSNMFHKTVKVSVLKRMYFCTFDHNHGSSAVSQVSTSALSWTTFWDIKHFLSVRVSASHEVN